MVIKTVFAFVILGIIGMLVQELWKYSKREKDESLLKSDLEDAKNDLRKHLIKSDVLDVEEDVSEIESENFERETKLRSKE